MQDEIEVCDFLIPSWPIVNLVDTFLITSDRNQCIQYIRKYNVSLSIFCKNINFCGLDLDFSLGQVFHEEVEIPYSSCIVAINSKQQHCSEELLQLLSQHQLLSGNKTKLGRLTLT